MIMKKVPHYTIHKRKEKQKLAEIRTGLPPRKCFFNVISLTLLPQWVFMFWFVLLEPPYPLPLPVSKHFFLEQTCLHNHYIGVY